ncbi:cobalamin biosynthesis protein CobW [Tistrella mobilis]|uniref:cobalamin biosynthesis protein CobW n=1 Tax=Tistrella mobilis TaxID=171437 RepID=UPI0035576B96
MNTRAKIPATIVTGFLGAGKTTLIRHLIENAGGRRLALIVNEFGDVGIDGDLLKGCGIDTCPDENVIELANGCICCTVADDFLPTMEALLAREPRPDHIIIETSGLALPKPLVQAFAWPGVKTRATVDGVIAVVDGAALAEGRVANDPEALDRQRAADQTLDHEAEVDELFEDQLACADMVVVTKADMLDADGMARARAAIAPELRPATRVVEAARGMVDPAVLLGLGAAVEDDLAARPSHHDGESEEEHGHDAFASFVVELPEGVDHEALPGRIGAAVEAHPIYRVKGFVAVPGKAMRLLVQGVGPRLQQQFDRPWQPGEARRSRLVVIGAQGLDPAAVAEALGGRPAS